MRMNTAARMAELREKLAAARLAACEVGQGLQGGFAKTMQERHEMQRAENVYRKKAAMLKRRIEAIERKRKMLSGGKKPFKPSALALNIKMKMVQSMVTTAVPQGGLILKPAVYWAKGWHGRVFDLIVFKGRHARNLVVKKYDRWAFPKGETQTSLAIKEFRAFQRLKKKSFHVPPTVRMVEIKGEKYIALTDLTIFGDIRSKEFHWAKKIAENFGIEEKAIEKVRQYVEKETAEAKKLGLGLDDAWEFLIDTKRRRVNAFILDLGINFDDASRRE